MEVFGNFMTYPLGMKHHVGNKSKINPATSSNSHRGEAVMGNRMGKHCLPFFVVNQMQPLKQNHSKCSEHKQEFEHSLHGLFLLQKHGSASTHFDCVILSGLMNNSILSSNINKLTCWETLTAAV